MAPTTGPLFYCKTYSKLFQQDAAQCEGLRVIIPIFTSNDAKEGAIAFAEKRKPSWTGT